MENRFEEYVKVQEQLELSIKDKSVKFPQLHAAIVLYTKAIYDHKNEHSLEVEINELYRFILNFFDK